MIKLVPPIAIDEDTVTSNAPADSYLTWGTLGSMQTVRAAFYASYLWEDPGTLDLYAVTTSPSKNTLYRKRVTDTAFSPIKSFADFATDGISGIVGDAGAGVIYLWGPYEGTGWRILSYTIDTGVEAVVYSTVTLGDDLVGATVDPNTHTIYFYKGELFWKIPGDVSWHAGDPAITFDSPVANLEFCASTGELYVATYDYSDVPTVLYKRPPEGGNFVEIGRLDLSSFARVVVDGAGSGIYLCKSSATYKLEPEGFVEVSGLSGAKILYISDVTGHFYGRFSYNLVSFTQNRFFNRGDKVVSGDYIYHSLTDANNSVVTDTDYWLEYSKVNALRMFDLEDLTSVTTITTADLTVTFETTGAADVVALFNTRCGQVDLYVHDGETQLYHETQTPGTRTVVFTDVPTGSGYVLTAVLSRAYDSAVSCGGVMAGVAIEIGRVLREPDVSVELLSFSDTVVDDFGKATFTRRGRSKSVSGVVRIDFSQVSEIYELFNSYDATKCLWVFESAQPFLALFGWYEKFTIKTKGISYADYTLKVMGAVDSAADDVYNFTVASYAAAIYNLVNTTLPLSMGEELWV